VSNLVDRARVYATEAHQRINHRRKYNNEPYHVHLSTVAKLVASVTGDEEMIAAAWLHDTVEDTQATLEDIEAAFGQPVAELVEELTDISRPGDGNRAVRKAIDRRHLAQASVRAKTVKLADLIDNCKDITRHDPRFARVYLSEMNRLLDVLQEGDERLLRRARKLHATGMAKLGLTELPEQAWSPPTETRHFTRVVAPRFRRMFTELFTAMDIAETLFSFDMHSSCADAERVMRHHYQDVASVRSKGRVQGYIRLSDLGEVACADCMRHFTADQVVDSDTTLSDVIHVLTRHDYCFVTLLEDVVGVIGRNDINKPIVRMWLFGLITMIEMRVVEIIQETLPDGGWQACLSTERVKKAQAMQAERQRRNQHCALLDCLQLSDKGRIIVEHPQLLELFGFDSKGTAKRIIKSTESLRNNLAHAQDIVTHDWAQIARLSRRVEELSEG
jgi:predicted transcriptional regulator